ncbi:MAG TPA: TRAP transporter small permease [Syntrophorhabdaceae bacterium]|nr:TRAP transporter small permease [Syntrophorhabdaceae bacterium]
MDLLDRFNVKTCSCLEKVAGFALVCVTVLTGCDIVGRLLGMPIPGTYEIVSFSGGLVVGLAIPVASRDKMHVGVDLLLTSVSPRVKAGLEKFNRLVGIGLVILLAFSIVQIGNEFRTSGEVSPVIHVPFYPVAYGIAVALVAEVFVLLGNLLEGGEAHE